jgi:hypothetical protein
MHTTTFGTETRAYFPVSLQPVFVGDEASKAGDFQAVVREDTGDGEGTQLQGADPRRALTLVP